MALDAAVKIVGAKQGAFAHQNNIKSRAGTSVVIEVTHEIEAPRDPHTGLSIGKREHRPVFFRMPLDSSAINIQTAIVNNEVLTSVVFNFYQSASASLNQAAGAGGSGGESKPYFTIELKNAVVSVVKYIHPYSRSVDPETKNRDIQLHVGLTYQAITNTWCEGGKVFNDDWTITT
jgi:type VI secretion system secreted protein Hcp